MGPTSITEVIDQHDLGDQLRGRAVQHAVDGAEEGGPALIVEGDDDAGVGECLQVAFAVAARGGHRGQGKDRVSFHLAKRTRHVVWLTANPTSSPAFRERVKAGDSAVTSEPPSSWHPEALRPIPAHTVHGGRYTGPQTRTGSAGGAALGFGALHVPTRLSLSRDNTWLSSSGLHAEHSPSVTPVSLPTPCTFLSNGGEAIYPRVWKNKLDFTGSAPLLSLLELYWQRAHFLLCSPLALR